MSSRDLPSALISFQADRIHHGQYIEDKLLSCTNDKIRQYPLASDVLAHGQCDYNDRKQAYQTRFDPPESPRTENHRVSPSMAQAK